MKFVLIDVCPPNAQEPVAAVTMGRSEVMKYFERFQASESWRLAYKLFEKYDWQPGNAMQLPQGFGWLFSVHDHVEL